jgi:hypothetical protein
VDQVRAAVVLLFWCGALLASLWYSLVAAGVVAGLLAKAGSERGVPVARWATLAIPVTGVALTAAEDIHGAALLAGLALASPLTANLCRRREIVER